MDLMKHSEEIDPLSYLKVGPVMLLDSLGIYGPNVWVIFKDVCEQNHARMLAVLRASWACFKRNIVGGFKQAIQKWKEK
jgi:hypothetical protein